MEREEKGERVVVGGGAEKVEILGLKLRHNGGVLLVGKKGGPCTPVATWKLSPDDQEETFDIGKAHHHPITLPSARKLCAYLWEIQQLHQQQQQQPSIGKMSKGGARHRQYRGKGIHELHTHLADPSMTPPHHEPASASSLRRHVAASLMQHHQSLERNVRALQPVSPASYGSSMEMTAYNPPITPTSSLDFKERHGQSSYNLKTSTELLKVLNRIWSLEEQHTANISLVKAMKMELDHAGARIKELLREQQADRNEIDDLMKQVAEDKLVRKSKEQERIKAAVQSVRDELEDERKLRKRSESLHRKLARELSDVKSAFAKSMKELERERKARTLLEDLCDEFAREIGDYEQEVRPLRHKSEKDHGNRDDHDRLIVHISEAWLDERMQMKHAEARSDITVKNTIVDKLCLEIEAFLQAKRSASCKNNDSSLVKDAKKNLRRHSVESVHLHEASAPQDVGDEEDSAGSDSHCFEINRNMGEKTSNNSKLREEAEEDHFEETRKPNPLKKKLGACDRIKGHKSSSQIQLEDQMARAMSSNGNKSQHLEGEEINPVEISISRKSEQCAATEEASNNRKGKKDGIHGSNSNHMIDSLIRSRILLADGGGRVHPENNGGEDSCVQSTWRGHASPVQQWVSRFTTPDIEISESSTKFTRGTKENTLKAKLIEARLEGQHSRIKSSKGLS